MRVDVSLTGKGGLDLRWLSFLRHHAVAGAEEVRRPVRESDGVLPLKLAGRPRSTGSKARQGEDVPDEWHRGSVGWDLRRARARLRTHNQPLSSTGTGTASALRLRGQLLEYALKLHY